MTNAFTNRREKLASAIGHSALLLTNPTPSNRNGDAHYRYRGSSHMLYLTDFEQPKAALLLIGGEDSKSYLFATEPNPHTTTWDGPLPSFEEIRLATGVTAVYDIKELVAKTAELTEKVPNFHVDLQNDSRARDVVDEVNRRRKAAIRRGGVPIEAIHCASHAISELRLFKDSDDRDRMVHAAGITREAHIEAMKACRPGMNERELDALIEFTFRRRGGYCAAYSSIVGTGNNATILHYTDNKHDIKDGDLVLIDAGVEYKHYAADVTRTFPANGTFTAAQKEIYEIVLDSQLKGIDAARIGNEYKDIHEASSIALAEGLIRLGVVEGDAKELINDPEFKKYYPHSTGHWLGMDVHDVGLYTINGTSRPLEAGMYLTVEPGLYFPENLEGVPDKYKGIGIRIEDDILVTSTEPEVITRDIPKSIEDIERVMAESSFYPLDQASAQA